MGLEQLPSAGLVGAAGVATLLVVQRPLARAAGAALFVGGAIPLGLHLESGVVDRVAHRPAVLAAGGAGLAAALVLGVLAAVRFPAAVPAAALVVGLRFPLSSHPRPVEHLAPMYAILVCGVLGLLWRGLRGKAPPNRLGAVGIALAVVVGVAALSLTWSVDVDQGAYALVAYYLPLGILAALIGTVDLTSRFAARLAALQIAIACVLGLVALYQEETRRLFFNDKLITTNAYTTFFRVNSLIFDPSLYGRFAMLALLTCVALLVLAPPSRAATAAAFAIPPIAAGLFFTYSQSSLVALAVRRARDRGHGVAAQGADRRRGGARGGRDRRLRAAADAPRAGREPEQAELEPARPRTPRRRRVPAGTRCAASASAATASRRRRRATRRSRLAPHDLIVEAASEQGLLGLGALLAFGVVVVRAVRAPRATPAEPCDPHGARDRARRADGALARVRHVLRGPARVGARRVPRSRRGARGGAAAAEPAAEAVEPRAVPA